MLTALPGPPSRGLPAPAFAVVSQRFRCTSAGFPQPITIYQYRYAFVIMADTKALKPSRRLHLVSRIYHPGPHHRKTEEVSLMASTALTRVTGTVLAINKRDGIIKNGPRAGEPWLIETANVLVANTNVTVVQLPRRDSFGQVELQSGFPAEGEIIDYLVEVSVYGQDVQARVLSDFPAAYAAQALDALTA